MGIGSIFVHESLSGSSGPADPLLPHGLAMRNAIVADLLRIDGLAVTCSTGTHAPLPDAPAGARLAAAAPKAGDSEVEHVAREAARHDAAWIVAPESGGMLAHLCDVVDPARWIGCNANAIRVASSKRATLKALARVGVPTPLALQASHRGRWIVKPDDGAGARATRVHRDCDAALPDLRERHAQGQATTLEPFVDGESLSIALLAGRGFVQPLAFNRQRIRIAAGGFLELVAVDVAALDMASDPRATRLHTLALDVARAIPGLGGIVGIDLVWHPADGPFVVEVNPRATTAYVGLSAALGRNVAEQVLLLHGLAASGDG